MVSTRFTVPMILFCALSLCGCPDGTPGKETAKNKWQDMLDELKKMDEASMKKHWKRYYQEAITELEKEVKRLNDKKVDLMVEHKMKKKQADELRAQQANAKKVIQGMLASYKEQLAKDPKAAQISLNDESYAPEKAKGYIKRLLATYKRKYNDKRVQTKLKHVAMMESNVGKLDIAINAYKDKIQQLKDQMEYYEVEMETAKLRDSMAALAESGKELSGEGIPELKQLSKLNSSLDKAITKSEIKEQLAKDEEKLKTKFASLDDLVKKSSASVEVGDLEKEIGGL